MLKTGDPGNAQPIATNLHVAPGTMVAEKSPGVFAKTSNSEARKSPPSTAAHQMNANTPVTPLTHTMPTVQSSAPSFFQHVPVQAPPPLYQSVDFQQQLIQALALQLQTNAAGAPAWLRAFMINNPAMPTSIFKQICTNNNVDGGSEDEHSNEPAPIPVPSFIGGVPSVCVASMGLPPMKEVKLELPEVKTERTQIKLEVSEITKEEIIEPPVRLISPTLSIDVLSTTSGGLMSGPSSDVTSSTPPLDGAVGLSSPGSSTGKKRKRTINDVVSFLHKKQAV